jgi:hypothetical protein
MEASLQASGSAHQDPAIGSRKRTRSSVCCPGWITVTSDGGEPTQVKAGDIAVFPVRWKDTWDIHETVRKVYSVF